MIVFPLLFYLAVATGNPAVNEKWLNFKDTFGKSYITTAEEKYREAVFHENLRFVDQHHQRFLDGLESYDVRINEFSDMTNDEFLSKMTGYIPSEGENDLPIPDSGLKDPVSGLVKPVSDLKKPVTYHSQEGPVANTVDWRERGAVNPVRGQGHCGSCYAFAAIATLESHHFLKTGELPQLSEQNAMDCVKNSTNSTSSTSFSSASSISNDGCNGGNIKHVYKYIDDNEGIDTLESYPYEAKNAECRFNPANVGAIDYGYVSIPKHDETAMKEAVHNVGPVSVALSARGEGFHHYHSGVYNNASCLPHSPNHAMVVVGYGTEDVGGAYWLVRNSWGENWGDGGYIRMARNKDNQCGIANAGAYPIV